MNKLAFIGGTGVYNPEILTDLHSETIETPYGTAKYELGYFKDKPIVFMARHGVNHTIPPHKINFRANIYALKALGVSSIVSTTAVGSLNPDYKPGELVLVDQFIDIARIFVLLSWMLHTVRESSSIQREPISVQKAPDLKLPLKSKHTGCGGLMLSV